MPYTAQPVGFLADVVQRIRDYTDEPVDEAKYTTDRLHPLIQGAYDRCMHEVNAVGENPIVVRWSLPITTDTQVYQLPPNIGQILRFGYTPDGQTLNTDWIIPRSRLNPSGAGIIFEGPVVRFEPAPTSARTLTVEYIPNGHCMLHFSTVAHSAGHSTTTFTPDITPDEGYFDLTPNAYLGSVLNLLDGPIPTTAGYAAFAPQGRIISDYAATTNVLTVGPAMDFNPATESGTLTYEIVPFLGYMFKEAIAWDVARKLHAIAGRRSQSLSAQQFFVEQMRLIRMTFANYNQRTGQSFRGDIPGIGRFGWQLGG